MKNENLKIVFGYIAICLLWGSTWLAIKVGVEALTPLFAAGTRFLLASIFIFIVMKITKTSLQTDKLSLRLYVIMGFFSFIIPFGLVYWAEQFISSGLASVLFAIFPFLVILFSYFALSSETIGAYKIFGVALGFFGLFVIFSENLSMDFTNDFWGMLAVVTSATMQAGVAVTIKKYGKNLNPLSMNFVPLLIAGIVMIPLSLMMEDSTNWLFSLPAIASIVYLAFFGTLVTFTIYYWLMKKIDVVLLSISAFVTPIVALVLGWFLLDEVLSTRHFVGSSLVLIGILFANFRGLIKYYKDKTRLTI